MRGMWTRAQTPAGYFDYFSSELPSGTADEKIVAGFFNNYLPQTAKALVDLGIGPGREMAWLDNLNNLSRIIGVDYSQEMIDFAKKQAGRLAHGLICEKDDLLAPAVLPQIVSRIEEPIVYVSLINSFGNFTLAERDVFLKNIKKLMRPADRLVICVYKRLSLKMKKSLPLDFPPSGQPKNKIDRVRLCFAREYALIPYVWDWVMENGYLPCFWYDNKNNDIVIHANGRRLIISHRFSRNDIKDATVNAGLTLEKILNGKFMYVAVIKKARKPLMNKISR